MGKIKIQKCFLLLVIFFPMAAISQTDKCDNPDAPELTRVYYTNGIFSIPNDASLGKTALESRFAGYSTMDFGFIYNARDPFGGDLLEVV